MGITIKQISKEHRSELKKIENTKSRFRKKFSKSFKSKVVHLACDGEERSIILNTFQISPTTLTEWMKKFARPVRSDSFKELKILKADNVSQKIGALSYLSPELNNL